MSEIHSILDGGVPKPTAPSVDRSEFPEPVQPLSPGQNATPITAPPAACGGSAPIPIAATPAASGGSSAGVDSGTRLPFPLTPTVPPFEAERPPFLPPRIKSAAPVLYGKRASPVPEDSSRRKSPRHSETGTGAWAQNYQTDDPEQVPMCPFVFGSTIPALLGQHGSVIQWIQEGHYSQYVGMQYCQLILNKARLAVTGFDPAPGESFPDAWARFTAQQGITPMENAGPSYQGWPPCGGLSTASHVPGHSSSTAATLGGPSSSTDVPVTEKGKGGSPWINCEATMPPTSGVAPAAPDVPGIPAPNCLLAAEHFVKNPSMWGHLQCDGTDIPIKPMGLVMVDRGGLVEDEWSISVRAKFDTEQAAFDGCPCNWKR